MRVSILFFVTFFLALSCNVDGQVSDINKEKVSLNHSIGIGAGLTTGNGLSYRYLPNKFGIQTTLMYHADDSYSNIGFALLYKLIQRENSMLYLYQGNTYSTYQTSQDYLCSFEPYYEWFHGFGFGVEIDLVKRIGLNLMGGFGTNEDFDELTLAVEAGLYFKF